MTTVRVDAGEATETTTGVERGLDVTVDLTVGDSHVRGDVTLLPADDGRPCYERWGELDHWLDGRLIRALDALDRDERRAAIDAIEAAAAAHCGRPGPSVRTTAEMVAKALGDDGSQFTSLEGESLDELARSHGARVTREAGRGTRYAFADGSAIIDAGGGWDVALSPDCWCWAGAGHSEECREQQAERA